MPKHVEIQCWVTKTVWQRIPGWQACNSKTPTTKTVHDNTERSTSADWRTADADNQQCPRLVCSCSSGKIVQLIKLWCVIVDSDSTKVIASLCRQQSLLQLVHVDRVDCLQAWTQLKSVCILPCILLWVSSQESQLGWGLSGWIHKKPTLICLSCFISPLKVLLLARCICCVLVYIFPMCYNSLREEVLF